MSKNLKQDRKLDDISSVDQLQEIKPKKTEAIPTDYQLDDAVEIPEESLKVRVARYYSSI
jgi:hypothetical protein